MLGLRARQKEDRRSRIIAAAKGLIAKQGLENITIEGIADLAGVSSVTVHNYYGTKSGILLALVAESDRQLLECFDQTLQGRISDLTDLVVRYGRIICEHTLTHLDKAIWRQVIAASVSDSDPRFGKLYHELDDRLTLAIVQEIVRLQSLGRVPAEVSAADLGQVLFHVQNMRFIQFVSAEEVTAEEIEVLLRKDMLALTLLGRPTDR